MANRPISSRPCVPTPHQGFTLVEFMLALAVAAIIIIAALTLYTAQMENVRAQKTVYAIQDLEETANSNYANNTSYSTIEGALADLPTLYVLTQEVPEGVVYTAPPAGNPTAAAFANLWGGTFTISTNNSVSGTNDLIVFSLSQIPHDSCVSIMNALAPVQYDTTVNGTLVGLSPPANAANNGRYTLNMNQALGLCQTSNNTMVFRLLKPLNFLQMRNYPLAGTMTAQESAWITPQYNRVQAAMAAREAAQVAIP